MSFVSSSDRALSAFVRSRFLPPLNSILFYSIRVPPSAAIRTAAEDPTVNLMPPIIDAVKTYATEEEISNAMRDVFGTYVEQAIV